MVENKSGKRIKVLQSDNGGDYTSGSFVDFYSEAEIKNDFIVLYHPQQNGVVEWKRRTIISAMKAMIHDQGVPMLLWEEACNTSVYVQNRCPHRRL